MLPPPPTDCPNCGGTLVTIADHPIIMVLKCVKCLKTYSWRLRDEP